MYHNGQKWKNSTMNNVVMNSCMIASKAKSMFWNFFLQFIGLFWASPFEQHLKNL